MITLAQSRSFDPDQVIERIVPLSARLAAKTAATPQKAQRLPAVAVRE